MDTKYNAYEVRTDTKYTGYEVRTDTKYTGYEVWILIILNINVGYGIKTNT